MNNINVYDLNNSCCGCTACASICPTKAIAMVENERGFYVPSVDGEKCIDCGLCKKVCQIGNKPCGNTPSAKYAVVNTDESVRMVSSSGGFFTMLLDALIAQYGNSFYCFGVAFDGNMAVEYRSASTLDECEAFRGSKYVQARLGDTYSKIAQLLSAGNSVLFVGTGCYCAGLKNYISASKANTDRLYTVDIVCHGTPSGGLWREYLSALEARGGAKISAYSFRNKAEGWRGVHPSASYENGTDVPRDDLFMSYAKLFGNLSLNNSCYTCKYACTERMGEITIGDFWGIEASECKELDDGRGVSLCLVNTEKGARLFNMSSASARVMPINDDSYLQPQLRYPTGKNILCDSFWVDFGKNGYEYVAKKYACKSKLYRAWMKACAKFKQVTRRLFSKNGEK